MTSSTSALMKLQSELPTLKKMNLGKKQSRAITLNIYNHNASLQTVVSNWMSCDQNGRAVNDDVRL